MLDYVAASLDKLVLALLLCFFGYFGMRHGDPFGQRMCDLLAGGLLTLIVQHARGTFRTPPPPEK